MPRVLFIASHRLNRSPSQRYRFEQYIPYLKENGFETELSHIISKSDDAFFYSGKSLLRKAWILLKSLYKRYHDKSRYNQFDIVFVQREAIMIGTSYFEKQIKKSEAKFIFDFDDSIWLLDTSIGNKKLEWLKNPEKTLRNIRYADMVFAGNAYLADYAKHCNNNVKIIPTTIDTDFHKPAKKENTLLTIGWMGSHTTIKHFEYAVGFLSVIKQKYPHVQFCVVGDARYHNKALSIKGVPWSENTEVALINSFSIGIMPLPNDEWAKGKCGLKGLSYMACEVPTVMSPVGVNTEIIQHGNNGFLASTTDEWVHCLSILIEDADLRRRIGQAGRQTVIEKYSVLSQREKYVTYFNEILKKV
ncbi:MAG: glycosyltransferase family 4 protein [Bacteroidetes bacterium]|nr:glycosyltransferase family 4 protein [Bacteroidota bacterium]